MSVFNDLHPRQPKGAGTALKAKVFQMIPGLNPDFEIVDATKPYKIVVRKEDQQRAMEARARVVSILGKDTYLCVGDNCTLGQATARKLRPGYLQRRVAYIYKNPTTVEKYRVGPDARNVESLNDNGAATSVATGTTVTLLPTDKYTAVGRNNRQGRDKDWLKTKLATLTPHERKIFMRKREDARLAGIDARLRHGKSIAARAMPRLDELGDIVH